MKYAIPNTKYSNPDTKYRYEKRRSDSACLLHCQNRNAKTKYRYEKRRYHMAAMGQTLSLFHRQNKIQIAASQIQNTTSQIQITDMKRGEVTRLLWVGLLVYCIAQTATFVLFVTHLAKVVKTSILYYNMVSLP